MRDLFAILLQATALYFSASVGDIFFAAAERYILVRLLETFRLRRAKTAILAMYNFFWARSYWAPIGDA